MEDDFTFSRAESEKDDEGRPPELDVVEMTEQMYRDVFFGPSPPKEKWYIAFIKKRRSQPHLWMC